MELFCHHGMPLSVPFSRAASSSALHTSRLAAIHMDPAHVRACSTYGKTVLGHVKWGSECPKTKDNSHMYSIFYDVYKMYIVLSTWNTYVLNPVPCVQN
jgi:hypothetical protein